MTSKVRQKVDVRSRIYLVGIKDIGYEIRVVVLIDMFIKVLERVPTGNDTVVQDGIEKVFGRPSKEVVLFSIDNSTNLRHVLSVV